MYVTNPAFSLPISQASIPAICFFSLSAPCAIFFASPGHWYLRTQIKSTWKVMCCNLHFASRWDGWVLSIFFSTHWKDFREQWKRGVWAGWYLSIRYRLQPGQFITAGGRIWQHAASIWKGVLHGRCVRCGRVTFRQKRRRANWGDELHGELCRLRKDLLQELQEQKWWALCWTGAALWQKKTSLPPVLMTVRSRWEEKHHLERGFI